MTTAIATTIDDAVLVVDKPLGVTSFDVVRQVRRAARVRRVGHGGTLDPLASGVLPICLGEATKLAQFLLDADKEYTFTVCFGVETDSEDASGAVTARADAGGMDAGLVERALAGFRGTITQVPPVYSALKRAGRPLYDYARAGEAVTPDARSVVIHALELVAFRGPEAVDLSVRCSKGTYVRALARDLGRTLGPGAHVTALRRTRSGPFALADAQPLDEVVAALSSGEGSRLRPVGLAAALGHLERRVVSQDMAKDLRVGRRMPWDFQDQRRLCLLDGEGDLVAVAEPQADGMLGTLRVFGVTR
jgi:tRNA pseudouridine55 synthase